MTKGEIWLPTSSIPQILEFWTESCKELGELTLESWSDLQEVLQGWVWPNILGRELTEEEIDRRRDVARRIVSSLVEKAQEHPGLALALKSWADLMEFSLTLPEDEGFSVIFPLTDHLSPENWEEEEEKRRQAARALATNWARRPEKDVVRLLARFAAEARTFGTQESQATSEFFLMLASQVEAPEEWLNEFLAERLPASWVNPILERVVRHRHRGWEKILELLLENDEYSWLAGGVTIRSEGIPRSLLDTALARIPDNLVETACHRKQVPLDTLKSLLGHEREEIAVAAAVGEWLSEPRGEVRPQIRAEWRAALIRLGSAGNVERSRPGQSYWLREILSSDPDLAAARLEARSRR